MRLEIVVRNSARCLDCGDEIVSEYGHHFVYCSCGQVAVDGGLEYTRRVYKEAWRWTDTSIFGDWPPTEAEHAASVALLGLVRAGQPVPDSLWSAAPILNDWSIVPARAPAGDGQMEIDAHIAGDDRWPFAQRIRTTPVLFKMDGIWVRTTSRFFRLGVKAAI